MRHYKTPSVYKLQIRLDSVLGSFGLHAEVYIPADVLRTANYNSREPRDNITNFHTQPNWSGLRRLGCRLVRIGLGIRKSTLHDGLAGSHGPPYTRADGGDRTHLLRLTKSAPYP